MPVSKHRQRRRHPAHPSIAGPAAGENDTSREVLRTTILEIVDNQIRNHDPPEALATYERLIGQGHSDKESRRLIGCVIAFEVVGIVNDSREYDRRRYLAALEALPRLP
jgi:hypothetical protein